MGRSWRGAGTNAAATLRAAAKPSVQEEPADLAEAEPSEGSDVAVSGIGVVPSAPIPPTGKDEWVALVGYANVRVAPSSNAESIKVAEKGTKFRATGRKGNWVQVTDPTTAGSRLGLLALCRGDARTIGETLSRWPPTLELQFVMPGTSAGHDEPLELARAHHPGEISERRALDDQLDAEQHAEHPFRCHRHVGPQIGAKQNADDAAE